MRGRVLDLGCGQNGLIRHLGSGTGVDFEYTAKPDIRVKSLDKLPFDDSSFDTVTALAMLNYIPPGSAESILKEVYRVLAPYGRLVLTVVSKWGGKLNRIRKVWEPPGMMLKEVRTTVEPHQFRLTYSRPFMLGLNRLYVFGKE